MSLFYRIWSVPLFPRCLFFTTGLVVEYILQMYWYTSTVYSTGSGLLNLGCLGVHSAVPLSAPGILL